MTPEQNRQRVRAYRIANPDKISAYNAAYWAANKERELARNREWKRRNKDRRAAYMAKYNAAYRQEHAAQLATYIKAWKKTNRAASRVHERRAKLIRRALMVNAPGSCTYEEFMLRAEAFGFLCRYCGCHLDENTVTADHQIPLSRGGSNWPSNLVPACILCNKRKHTKTYSEFLHHRRRAAGNVLDNRRECSQTVSAAAI